MPITEPKLKGRIEKLLKFGEDPESAILDMADEVDRKMAEMTKLAEELRAHALTLKPGKNANPEEAAHLAVAIIEKSKGESPKTESGADIVKKINSLPLVEEQMIDASHIKNMPKGGSVVTRINKFVVPQYETPSSGTLGTDTVYVFTHEIGQLVLNGQTQDPNIDYSGQGTNVATFLNGITPQPSSLINIYYN